MIMDKVTGCARLIRNSEFGIRNFGVRFADVIKMHRAKVVLSPCSVSIKVFEILSAKRIR